MTARRAMKARPVCVTAEASLALASMSSEESYRWAVRIDRIAAGRPYRAARPVRGIRHLFRLEADGWFLLYRAPPGRGRVVIVVIGRRRLERMVDAVLEAR